MEKLFMKEDLKNDALASWILIVGHVLLVEDRV